LSKVGYIKSWRKELESDIWVMSPIYHRVWTYLLKSASWESNEFPTTRKFKIALNPGQMLTSMSIIAEGISWFEYGVNKKPNRKTIKSVLDWLEHNRMIAIESNRHGTFITVCNWCKYQPKEKEKVTITGQPTGQPTGHTKEVKEVKEVTTNNITPTERQKINALMPSYFSKKEWGELYSHRGKKKAAQTERSYLNLLKEFDKAHSDGKTADDILNAMSSGKGWTGFKYEWMKNPKEIVPFSSEPKTQKGKMARELLRRMQ